MWWVWILALATLIGGVAGVVYLWNEWLASAGREKPVAPAPTPPAPEPKWVDLNYAADSGLQVKLEAEGYKLRWSRDDQLARCLDLEGWETVIVEQDGQSFVLKGASPDSNLTLIKKKA